MGFEGGMLKLLTAGMGPVNSGLALLFEVFSMSVLRLVAAGYLWYYGRLATASAKAQTELGLDSGNKLTKKDG
uniref:Uncharacterized protein n=1 Tax=Chromera velia CCMP2878 TaxID=1169474 RepID=A0A0G4HVI6_9ALVE|eukprot:Cvel_32223.t1-p1 / transcript=Cvel_32223.t1 / gene=Cvel_32223 / organism=Chromera_velia_CCMP2878 / gene_product=hypothetical protein / transcript_product=hypothetical protein / location=Cvel_scaffold4966:5610-6936(-) / protein_length=72 / sequence_SO=supercontig / SO=protein_coding / is_pseudo=false